MNMVETSHPGSGARGSLAFFGVRQGLLLRDFVQCAKSHIEIDRLVYVTPAEMKLRKPAALTGKDALQVIIAGQLGFERVPVSLRAVGRALAERLAATPTATVLAVDMGWGLQTASATANFEGWTGVSAGAGRTDRPDRRLAL